MTKTGLFSKWFNNSTNEKRPPLIYEFVFLLISSILKVRSVTLLEEECPSPSPLPAAGVFDCCRTERSWAHTAHTVRGQEGTDRCLLQSGRTNASQQSSELNSYSFWTVLNKLEFRAGYWLSFCLQQKHSESSYRSWGCVEQVEIDWKKLTFLHPGQILAMICTCLTSRLKPYLCHFIYLFTNECNPTIQMSLLYILLFFYF